MEANQATSKGSRTVVLVLRLLTFVFLLTALIILATNTATVETTDGDAKIKFQDFIAFRYMIATIVIGFAYNLLQTTISIYNIVTGNRLLSGDAGYLFDFYGDKVVSYLLATGAAAGLGVAKELHPFFTDQLELPLNKFFAMAYASGSLLLLGFITTAISSVFSSYALPKKVQN